MDVEYAQRYRDLYARHWWWRSREAAILAVMHRCFAPDARRRILDVGCGDGLFFDRLAEFGQVDGIEPDAALVDPQGRHHARIRIAEFDARFHPAERYGLIVMFDVLEHLPEPAAALEHARALLEPDGVLLLTVPAFRVLWTHHDVINHHYTRYRRRTLRPLLRRAGFVVVEERYWYQWLWPVKLLVRAWERIADHAVAAERVPSPWINRCLYMMSRLEQRTISALGVPFGTSLMVLCRPAEPLPTPQATSESAGLDYY